MTVGLVFFAAAESDIAAGADWYESQLPGLGDSFIKPVFIPWPKCECFSFRVIRTVSLLPRALRR